MRQLKMAWVAMGWALALSLGLTACGGGGGGDGPGSGGFRVSVSQTSMGFDYIQGVTPQAQTITATGTGDPGGNVYVAVLIEGEGFSPSGVTTSLKGSTAFFSFTPRTDLAPGTYTGRVILQACPDPNCTRQFSGSPVAVSYTNIVHHGLSVTPPFSTLSATAGQQASAHIAVERPGVEPSFTATVAQGEQWLSVKDVNADGFTVVTRPLPIGTYGGSVSVRSGIFSAELQVGLTVTAAGGDHDLQVSTNTLNFNVGATGKAASQSITVTPPSWTSELSASVRYGDSSGNSIEGSWLSTQSNGDGTWSVNANALNLLPGTYIGNIRFSSGFQSLDQSIYVTLVVGEGLDMAAAQGVLVDADATLATLARSTTVQVAGSLPFNWTASTTTPWLQLDTTIGTADAPLRWHVTPEGVAALANFSTAAGLINITTDLPNVPTGKLAVSIEKKLPEVHAVAPYLVVRGKPAQVLVTGRGFDGMLNPAATLSLSGITPTQVTRINDRVLQVQLPAVNAASAVVQASNALSQSTGSATLKTVAAQTLAYAALPSLAGDAKSMIYDAERRSLYLVRTSTRANALTRLSFNGTAWTNTPLVADDLFDIALSPDGTSLIAAMVAGELRWLDPNNGADLKVRLPLSQTLTDDRPFFQAQGLSITADSRLWLSLDQFNGSPFKTVTSIDLLTGEASVPGDAQLDPSARFIFHQGPTFTVPRNGSGLLGRQNAGLSGSDDTYYAVKVDTASGKLTSTPKVRSPFDLRFTHDGQRVLVDMARVIDSNDDLLGLVRVPAADQSGWLVAAAQISSNGARVYLLAYPNTGFQESSASGLKPRVYVINSSAASADPAGFPVLGYFEINDYPSTCVPDQNSNCWASLSSTLSPDDNTLFFSGSLHTLVVPISTTLKAAAKGAAAAALWPGAGLR